MSRTRFARLLLWSSLALPHPSLAEEPKEQDSSRTEAVAIYRRGQSQYNQGDYRGAIASFRASFALSRAPGLLFNVAQAYRLLGDCARARSVYGAYLRLEQASEAREAAERHMMELTDCRPSAQKAGAEELAADDRWIDSLERRIAPTRELLPTRPMDAQGALAPPSGVVQPAPTPSTWPLARMALVGGGAVVVAGGAVLVGIAYRQHQLLSDPTQWSQLSSPAAARQAATLGSVSQVTGIALIAAGAGTAGFGLLFFPIKTRSGPVALSLDGRTLTVAGRFE